MKDLMINILKFLILVIVLSCGKEEQKKISDTSANQIYHSYLDSIKSNAVPIDIRKKEIVFRAGISQEIISSFDSLNLESISELKMPFLISDSLLSSFTIIKKRPYNLIYTKDSMNVYNLGALTTLNENYVSIIDLLEDKTEVLSYSFYLHNYSNDKKLKSSLEIGKIEFDEDNDIYYHKTSNIHNGQIKIFSFEEEVDFAEDTSIVKNKKQQIFIIKDNGSIKEVKEQ